MPDRADLPSDLEDIDDGEALAPQRRSSPLALGVTVLGLAMVAYLLHDLRSDIGFWLSAPAAIDLGRAGDYRLDAAADGALARIEGLPGSSADRFTQLGKRYEIVAVRGTNVLVRREMGGPDLPLPPGKPEPGPEPKTFSAEGRLVLDTSIPEYAHAFRLLVERGDATPRNGHLYVLLDGEKPRTGWKIPGAVAALLLLAAFNLWTIARYFRR